MNEVAEPGCEPKCLVCLPGDLPLSASAQGRAWKFSEVCDRMTFKVHWVISNKLEWSQPATFISRCLIHPMLLFNMYLEFAIHYLGQ